LLLVILAGGLAWQQVLLKPYVKFHNETLEADKVSWLNANAPIWAANLQREHPDWNDQTVKEAAETAARAEYAKLYLVDYDETENRQMLRRVLEPGPRGDIKDRKGRMLATDEARYSLVVYLDELRPEIQVEFGQLRKDWLARNHDDTTETKPTTKNTELMKEARYNVVQKYLNQANALLGRQEILDQRSFEQHVTQNLLPYTLIKDLRPEEYARFNALWPVDSPMQTTVEALRKYPYGSSAFHVLGYVSLTDDFSREDVPGANLPKKDSFTYKGMVGKAGLEALYDNQLSGKTGGEIWVVDPAMRLHERVAQQTPQKGEDLQCSLDIDLQRVAEQELFKGDGKVPYTGSAVALDVRTGEILAMASSPTFDLNRTVPYISYNFNDEVGAVDGWLNRATQGLYPPGSTFKLISTIAGLRAGKLSADTIYDCDVYYVIGGRPFWDDNKEVPKGKIGVVTALTESSDVFYYRFGEAINQFDKNLLSAEARRMGLGQATGLGLDESALHMIVPDAAWKKLHHPEDNKGKWTDGDAANLAVGQGYLQVTPLQMACVVASIARDETRTQPTLIHNPHLDPATINHGGEPLGLTPEQRNLLITGMEHVVSDEHGTGHAYGQIPGLSYAAKTGTAEWGSHKKTTIAWYVCYAPVNNPRIAVAVAVESPIGAVTEYYGGRISAPIAKALLQEYFKDYPEAQK